MGTIIHKKILTIPVAVTSYEDAIQYIVGASREELSGQYICVANVHMCMEAFDSMKFNEVVNNANLVVPDGVPLVWGLKALGQKKASQVRGSDLMMKVCARAEKEGVTIGLYGGTPEALEGLLNFLKNKFPNLKIPFASSPPFRPLTKEEDENYIKKIKNSGARILFVGIGCPKQENWMAEHQERLSCLMIGVGAAFDFFSGRKRHAPRWMQKAGLEWLFRLASDPKRLWRRYLKHNPRFIWYFGRQLLAHQVNAVKRRKEAAGSD